MSADNFKPREAPRWDARHPTRTPYIEWLPFQKLDQPWKINAALRAGSGAFVAIALSHGFSAFSAWISPIRGDTLLFGYDKSAVLTANLLVGLFALCLAAVTFRAPSRPLYYLALAWSLIELIPPLTYGLYGHGAGYFISLFGLAVAMTGVQGIHARRRFRSGVPTSSQL
ncbi:MULTISPECIES: hypothetical protein [Brevundimonas]|uniref:hypothetical protein n=1 Tax=Brevundimonas TaxID=41275 RepID=UPI0005F839EC|nr:MULTISPECIES: hypothetical protein [Brevundimonas]KJV41293.1 hypothetical protein VH88_09480 [Brevundimonas sp. KM4]MBC1184062.1 hypothetical protein [Brevundimonas huaxiensis]